MKPFNSIRLSIILGCMFLVAVLITPQLVRGATWQATVGAQSDDHGRQGLAFLPNELWVNVGDSITWTFATDEVHTVTFLEQDVTPQQTRPANTAGCPAPGGLAPDGRTLNPSLFDGSACVNSGRQASGSYTVSFPTAGNFKLVCLVHANMTGTIHVLNLSDPLPHDQAFYDDQAKNQRNDLLSDGVRLRLRGIATAEEDSGNAVSVGIGEIVATGGGSQTMSVMRFLRGTTVVRVGDTVEWTNLDPVTSHTVTFGAQPANNNTPAGLNPNPDPDGARHAVISSTADNVNSAFIVAANQDRQGLAQSPLSFTRFRVTFTRAGVFDYFCALHSDLGMKGRVIVLR
jgi:plastocyanin